MRICVKILKEILYSCLIFIGVSVLTFALGRLAPGDAVDTYLGAGDAIVTEEEREAARRVLGLDRPVPVQYADWLFSALKGDLGTSYDSGKPVLHEILVGMPVTATLTLMALLLGLLISVPCAWTCAVSSGKLADHLMRLVNTTVMALPTFCIGLLIMFFFGVRLKWFPIVSGTGPIRYVMPTLTLGLGMSGGMIRFFRTHFLEAIQTGHITYLRSMGVPWGRIFRRHVLRNTAFPVITYLGLRLGGMLGGSYIIENLFALGGAGSVLVSSVGSRDYPMIQGYALMMAAIYIAIRISTEALGLLFDPRAKRKYEVGT